MAVEAVPVAIRRLVGAPEAREVRTDDPVPGLHQRGEHLAVEERPGRLAVEADDRFAVLRALVHIVQPQTVDLDVVGLEVVARKALEALVWGAEDVHAARSICVATLPGSVAAPVSSPA